MDAAHNYVLGFDDPAAGDVATVGGKNASLSNMVRTLRAAGLAVPDGFATTAAAFREYVVANNIESGLRAQVAEFKAGRTPLHEAGSAIRRLFLEGEFSPGMEDAVRQVRFRDGRPQAKFLNPRRTPELSSRACDWKTFRVGPNRFMGMESGCGGW